MNAALALAVLLSQFPGVNPYAPFQTRQAWQANHWRYVKPNGWSYIEPTPTVTRSAVTRWRSLTAAERQRDEYAYIRDLDAEGLIGNPIVVVDRSTAGAALIPGDPLSERLTDANLAWPGTAVP